MGDDRNSPLACTKCIWKQKAPRSMVEVKCLVHGFDANGFVPAVVATMLFCISPTINEGATFPGAYDATVVTYRY